LAKLLLIDGHALLYRSFHATADSTMSTSLGEPTNATFAFASILLKTLQSEAPTHGAVAFDLPTPTFRHKLYAAYKGHRPPMPEALVLQVGRIRQMVAVFGFPVFEMPGFEADDVLGTLSQQASAEGVDSLILTGDLDTLQLVGPHVKVLTPGRGPMAVTLYDADAVLKRYALTPERIPDYKALVGDPSDNIPGVPGVGDKTASKLLGEYHTVENLFLHLDDLPPRLRKLLDGRQAQANTSKYLATIITDVPVTLNLDQASRTTFDREAAFHLFTELEFFSLIDRLPGGPERAAPRPAIPVAIEPAINFGLFADLPSVGGAVAPAESLATTTRRGAALPVEDPGLAQALAGDPDVAPDPAGEEASAAEAEATTVPFVIDSEEAFSALLDQLPRRPEWVIDVETTGKDPMQAALVGIALSADVGLGYYIPVGHHQGVQLPLARVLDGLRPWLMDPEAPKIGHNIKYDITVLMTHGAAMRGVAFDTMIAAYLLNPAQRGLGLKDQAAVRFGIHMTPIADLIGTGKTQRTMAEVPIQTAAAYAVADADFTLRLRRILEPELQAKDLFSLFRDVEMPLVPVLADMEAEGVDLDVEFLRGMSVELQEHFRVIEQQIFALVGHPFTINSPKQLETVLFKERGLPTGKRTATGYSTDAAVLERLRGADPVVDLVLEYRQLTKLRSTYVEGLPALINPLTGRVHTSFNQTIAATGRLSSSEPNLQNIPIRTEIGQKVRRAFVVREPGWVLLAADYSQIELRIVAHLSQDSKLLEAFAQDLDIHASTASLVFGVPREEVTYAMRRLAKTVNFGIIYGLSAFGLAPRAGVSQQEARTFIENYNATYSGLHAYMEGIKADVLDRGYVSTMLNRRRYLPEVLSPLRTMREEALRQAINMPVQGTAADMIKVAMIQLHERLRLSGLRGRMILQVHDELLLRVPEAELTATAALVRATMEQALPLSVSVKVDLEWGRDWYTMQHLAPELTA
jgi:DNA polymerase-1